MEHDTSQTTWHEIPVTINGYSYGACYNNAMLNQVLIPVLQAIVVAHEAKRAAAASGCARRTIAFLAGPPAAGKSTLAYMLQYFSEQAVGMRLQAAGLDGFHHYNDYLRSHTIEQNGTTMLLAAIKGAPETFDVARFSTHLTALQTEDVAPWPVYDRNIHEPREGALLLDAPLVLIEGNWLLLDEKPWSDLASCADVTIFLRADEKDLHERAVTRKVRGGLTKDEAEAHYARTDGPNIRRVLERSLPADITLKLCSDGSLQNCEGASCT